MPKPRKGTLEDHVIGHVRGVRPKGPDTPTKLRELQRKNAGLAFVRILTMSRSQDLRKKDAKLYKDCNEYVYEAYYGQPKVSIEPLSDLPIQFIFKVVDKKEELDTNEGELKELIEGQEEDTNAAASEGSDVQDEGLWDTADTGETD